MGIAYDKQHAVTAVLIAAVQEARFVAFDGAYATSAGGVHDAQGVSESAGEIGDAVSVITAYSAPVEVSEAIALGDFIKPAADGSGRAAVGTASEHCGRALSAAPSEGLCVEVMVLPHVHTPAP